MSTDAVLLLCSICLKVSTLKKKQWRHHKTRGNPIFHRLCFKRDMRGKKRGKCHSHGSFGREMFAGFPVFFMTDVPLQCLMQKNVMIIIISCCQHTDSSCVRHCVDLKLWSGILLFVCQLSFLPGDTVGWCSINIPCSKKVHWNQWLAISLGCLAGDDAARQRAASCSFRHIISDVDNNKTQGQQQQVL